MKEIDKELRNKNFKKVLKKLLTSPEASDILSKSLEGDKKKHKVTTKVVRKKMVFEN